MELTFVDADILRLARKIKPVIKGKGVFGLSRLFYVAPFDIKQPDYTHNATKICQAPKELIKISTVDMYFRAVGYKDPYKPTIEDALCQIPLSLRCKTVAFEVEPDYTLEDYLNNADYLKGKTTLYGIKNREKIPEQIENQDVVMGKERFSASEIDDMTFDF